MWYYLKTGDIITKDCFYNWSNYQYDNGYSIARFQELIGQSYVSSKFAPMRRFITKTPKGNKRQ